MYLLDTNACVQVLRGKSPGLVERLRGHAATEIRLSSIVKAELFYGARRSQRVAENLSRVGRFAEPFVCLPFDDLCAEHYGLIRTDLTLQGRPISAADLMIAATARAHDAVLVTHNVQEFARVIGLQIEDWEAGA